MTTQTKTPPQPQHLIEPTPGKEKQKARLKNWSYPGDFLRGNVYDHPMLPDGLYVRTTRVLWIDLTLKLAETRNTVYILEGPPA